MNDQAKHITSSSKEDTLLHAQMFVAKYTCIVIEGKGQDYIMIIIVIAQTNP